MNDCDLAAGFGIWMGFLIGLALYSIALALAYRMGIVEYVGIRPAVESQPDDALQALAEAIKREAQHG